MSAEGYTLADFIDLAWEIDCTRCANIGRAYEKTEAKAAYVFHALGWTVDGAAPFCPQCSGAPGVAPQANFVTPEGDQINYRVTVTDV